jgi:hypothetical protein
MLDNQLLINYFEKKMEKTPFTMAKKCNWWTHFHVGCL